MEESEREREGGGSERDTPSRMENINEFVV